MNPSKPRLRPRVMPVPPGYLETVRALDQRRRDCGLSHNDLCRLAGIAARSWAKYLAPSTRHGRLASEATLAKVQGVLK